MATLTLTDLDKELLDGLQVLTDQEIGRVQAHLAAGLPMQIDYGWTEMGQPACFGCLVGTAMSKLDKLRHQFASEVRHLALNTFPHWAMAAEGITGPLFVQPATALSRPTLDRLAALLDMEWSRRHPVDTTVPSPEQITQAPSPVLIREGVPV